MTLDEAIEMYTNNAEYERTHGNLQGCLDFKQLAEWLKDYKRLKEQQPCEDVEVKKIDEWEIQGKNAELWIVKGKLQVRCLGTIHNIPLYSVTPQQKIGRWIYDKNIENWRCSECESTPKTMGYVGTGEFMTKHFKFCNHCGAKMQGAEE